jgi:chromosomal replication initiator protein
MSLAGNGYKLESAKQIWNRALGELQLQVSKANYDTWLSSSQGLNYEHNVFVVGVPNVFVAEWLSKRLYPLVRKTLVDIVARDVDVQFLVNSPEQQLSASPSAIHTDGGTSTKAPRYRLNPKYTFDNLLVSDFNRLAYAAAVEVAENPGSSYNPLFIHSSTGQGKTHLLHAIGHLTTNNGLRTAYTTAEQFANEFVSAVRENQVDKFRSKFRSIQILLFDDAQFLVDKKQTLQCFFHTFDELYSNNRQIVITADCAPKEMQPLGNKLKSRLEGGLVIDIQPPDFQTRLDILRAKAEKTMVDQLDGVLRIVAEKVCQNVRQLEGALICLTAHARLTGTKLTPQIVNKLLTGAPRKQDTNSLLQAVADHFDLSTDEIVGKKRDKRTSLARHITVYLMREDHNSSLTEIGSVLGGRNHATILHGYERIAGELGVNPHLQAHITEIKKKINSQRAHGKSHQSVHK